MSKFKTTANDALEALLRLEQLYKEPEKDEISFSVDLSIVDTFVLDSRKIMKRQKQLLDKYKQLVYNIKRRDQKQLGFIVTTRAGQVVKELEEEIENLEEKLSES